MIPGSEVFLPSKLMARHCLGIAATGAGKSNFLNLILKQQMMRGGGVIHIDGKNSEDAIREFLTLARQHDRWQDVRIINIDNAKLSSTYNPLLRGDSEQLVNRVMLLIGGGGKDAFFRSQAGNALRAIIGILNQMKMPFNFNDLQMIMTEEGALRHIIQNAPQDTREYVDLRMFVEQISEVDRRTGVKQIDSKKRQFAFGDLLGKISAYGSGAEMRDVLNPYNPEVDVLQAMLENQLVYVGLPMLMKGEAATDFAKIFLSDILTAVGQLQNVPVSERPNPTFLVLMDEFSSYAMPTLAPLFEQARSANICLFPLVQTMSSLSDQNRGLGTDFRDKIIGNTWNKIVFKLQDNESREEMSKLAGEAPKEVKSVSYSESISFASGNDDASLLRTGGRGRGTATQIKMEYDAVVRPEEFGALTQGEGIFIGMDGVFKIRVPEVVLKQDNEGLDFPRFRMPVRPGLDLQSKYHTFGGGGRRNDKDNPGNS
jgi:hypothetical protein